MNKPGRPIPGRVSRQPATPSLKSEAEAIDPAPSPIPSPPEPAPTNLPDHPRDSLGNPLHLMTGPDTDTGRISDGDHLGAGGAATGAPAAPPAPEFMTLQQFQGLHRFAWNGAHSLTKLNALAILDTDAPRCAAADAAAAALYETCMEVPALHFLIRPAGKWMERAMAIGLFVGPTLIAARLELAARRARPVQDGDEGDIVEGGARPDDIAADAAPSASGGMFSADEMSMAAV